LEHVKGDFSVFAMVVGNLSRKRYWMSRGLASMREERKGVQ
jgi:hypothetical protein